MRRGQLSPSKSLFSNLYWKFGRIDSFISNDVEFRECGQLVTHAAKNQRREVYYSGKVQGVGFRYTTSRIAQQFDVVGLVRNLPDGRVHVVAEGTPAELDGFLSQVEAAMVDRISGRKVDTLEPSNQFSSFEITH